jgi:hypothetical protein
MERNALILTVASAFLALVVGFSYGTVWSRGCDGMAAAGAVAGCAEFILFRYQTLIGVGGAVAAALIAARPVWRQLSEMVRQNEAQTLEYLRRRSVELDREQTRIYEITSSIDIAMNALFTLANTRQPVRDSKLLFGPAVAQYKGAETYLDEMVRKFDLESGPLWGSTTIHDARATAKDDAQRLAVALSRFSTKVTPNTPMIDAELEEIARELTPLKTSVFDAALIVHQAIVAERARVGRRISALEEHL